MPMAPLHGRLCSSLLPREAGVSFVVRALCSVWFVLRPCAPVVPTTFSGSGVMNFGGRRALGDCAGFTVFGWNHCPLLFTLRCLRRPGGGGGRSLRGGHSRCCGDSNLCLRGSMGNGVCRTCAGAGRGEDQLSSRLRPAEGRGVSRAPLWGRLPSPRTGQHLCAFHNRKYYLKATLCFCRARPPSRRLVCAVTSSSGLPCWAGD